MPKVSFVLPAYKRSFLKEAIDSILSQTYHDFELIVVDDCSPEGLKEIIDMFHDDRLTYHRNEANIGGKDLVAAWNHAITYAQGEWCILASDDDVYLPKYLETLLSLTTKYPTCDLFHSRLSIINSSSEWIAVGDERILYENCMQMIYARGVRRLSQMAPDFMFRLSALRKIGGFVHFPKAWYSDDATWFCLSKNGCVCAPEILFCFRQSGHNLSTQYENLYEKQIAAENYKVWFASFIQTVNVTSAEDGLMKKEMLLGVFHAIDQLCRFEMNQSDIISWFVNFKNSPVSGKLKLRFVYDFIMRPVNLFRSR